MLEKTAEISITNLDNSWVVYPDGIRLPAIPNMELDECPVCDCNPEDFHVRRDGFICEWETCPRCFGDLKSCGCLDSERLFPREKMSRDQIVERINEIATAFTGEETKLDQVIGETNGAVLWAKYIAFEELILHHRAAEFILSKYPDVIVRNWDKNGTTRAWIKNARIARRRAVEIWFKAFWK